MVGVYGVSMESSNLGAGTILNNNLMRKRMLDELEELEKDFFGELQGKQYRSTLQYHGRFARYCQSNECGQPE